MVLGGFFLLGPLTFYHSAVIVDLEMSNEIRDLAPKMPTQFLRDFFAEKDIPEVSWDLIDDEGMEHHMPNTVVVEHIAICSVQEAKKIEGVLRQIDFHNGDVNHFFKHLAGALINKK